MKIETKTQFNHFSSHIKNQLSVEYHFNIKISNLREALSKAVGATSHNNLLSQLPLDHDIWLEKGHVSKFETILGDRHGFYIDTRSTIEVALSSLVSEMIQSGSELAGIEQTVISYASVSNQEQASVKMTILGRAVFDAVNKLLPKSTAIGDADFDKLQSKIAKIIACYPKNPWPKAMWVCWVFQNKIESSDFDLPQQRSQMSDLLVLAVESVELFKELFGVELKDLDITQQTKGAMYYWPAILYFGRNIALYEGRLDLGEEWLKLSQGFAFESRMSPEIENV